MEYNFTDAWVLNSIYFSEDKDLGAKLHNIIAYADYTNHCILEYAELIESLKKLMENELVLVLKNGNLHVAPNYENWIKNKLKNKSRFQVFKLIEDTEKFMRKLNKNISENNPKSKPFFSNLEYQMALEKYLNK